MAKTLEIGGRSERAAAEWLMAEGFELQHMNWRKGRYELDIVAFKDGKIHFVEVKSRKKGSLTTPEEAITAAKFRSLCVAAEAYIEVYGIEIEPQFDLIAVEHSDAGFAIRYIPDAMAASW